MRSTRPAAVAVLVLTLLCGLVLGPLRETTWKADASEMVVISGSASPLDAYQYDVIARRFIMDTYTTVVGARRFQTEAGREVGLDVSDVRGIEVKVHASPTSAVITASAEARRAWVAEGMARLTLVRGRDYIASLDTLFVVEPVARTHARRVSKLRLLPIVTLFTLATVLTWAACQGPRRAKRPPSWTG